jgi:hypothetical protein
VFKQVAEKTNISTQGVIADFMHGISDSNDSRNPTVTLVVGEVDAELQKEGLVMLYPTENVARAYAGVAGMLNLLCIIDAIILSFMGVYGEREPSDPATGKGAA